MTRCRSMTRLGRCQRIRTPGVEAKKDVLDKRRESVVVIIDEVDPDNWGEGGESVAVLRERRR